MMTEFTPWSSLAGGAIIGAAAVLLMASLGRIMGATGILAGILSPDDRSDWSWRTGVLAGMISGPVVVWMLTGSPIEVAVSASTPMLVASGLLVGIGVTLGSGCTSGHGVCGMARLSRRSIAATMVFMIFTGATVYLMRHILGG